MEMMKRNWLYRYENNMFYPVFEVCEEGKKIKYELNNSEDCMYTFCKVELEMDSPEDCEIKDIYTLVVPGDINNSQMIMTISSEEGSPFVYVVVRNAFGECVVEENYLVGEIENCKAKEKSSNANNTISEINNAIEYQDRFQENQSIRNDSECDYDIKNALRKLDTMPGLGEIKNKIEELIEYVQLQQLREKQGLSKLEMSHHLVFQGNPGTGKTIVARLLADIYYSLGIIKENKVIETDRSGLVEGYIGGTAIKTQKVIESALGGILYIDEAYTLSKDGNDFGQESIDTLLKAMEDHRDEFIVIVAGYPEPMSKFIYSNPGLKSRFKTFIDFNDYTGEELFQIFIYLCEQNDLIVDKEVIGDLKEYFIKMSKNKGPNFANGREVRNYFESTITHQAHRISTIKNPTKNELSCIKRSDFDFDNDTEVEKSAIEELSGMIGLRSVKKEVNTLLSLTRIAQQREEKGLPVEKISYHMVFTGNPGTGKTTVARIMSRILKSLGIISKEKVIEVSASDLIAGYTGQTAIKTKDVINSAIGGVLFIDEAYALERSVGGFGQEAIDTLLKYMEDYRNNLVVIVAGYEDYMKNFINSNPGLSSRFTNYIHFEDYSVDELMEIFKQFCEKQQYIMDEDAASLLYKFLGEHKLDFNGNGRDIRNLFEKVKKQQSARLGGNKHSEEELVSITNEDIKYVISNNV